MPVQSIQRPAPSFNLINFRRLGVGFPDQELVNAVATRSIETKDKTPVELTLYGTNHKSGLDSWRFVTKANEVEKEKKHLFGFPTAVSPPIYPAMYSPTGAVLKKDRLGQVDAHNRRPTSDFSWPAHGYWLEWIVQSVNDSIDLETDFPWVKYVGFKDFAAQALYLKALGEEVV